jgi:hypothetical protein
MLSPSGHVQAGRWWSQPVSITPLVTFRVLFGLIMCFSMLRFLWKGWVHELYVVPEFHFTYLGFNWVKPLPETGMFIVVIILAISALGIALGWFYRWSALLFFILFTYVELIDKTYYLNHYYFVSLVSFLLLLLPAGNAFSVDVYKRKAPFYAEAPVWTPRLLLCLVYFYAGLAKLNEDWLLSALPLKIWLQARSHYPIVGPLFTQEWVAYAFSWGGVIYDLSIPFLLCYKPTRVFAYILVIIFHLLTRWLFPIGMFPYIMIGCTLIFFSDQWHLGWQRWIGNMLGLRDLQLTRKYQNRILPVLMATILFVQVLLPWRYLLYPGNLFWTEEGYRFSWRVMLMEKAGMTIFYVGNKETGITEQVLPSEYLTPQQEKMMSTQPDMIWQFAHFLEEKYKEQGAKDVSVKVESYVALNGRRSRPFIDPRVDLTKEKYNLCPRKWILPFE